MALFSLFPVSVSTPSPFSLPGSLIPRLAWFLRAYLRGTYLPELSGNLTPAPSPGRSPPFQPTHPPCFRNYLSHFPTSPRAHTDKHTHTTHALVAFPPAENSDRTLSSRISHLVTRCCRYERWPCRRLRRILLRGNFCEICLHL